MNELEKTRRYVELLKDQYNKLQAKASETERKYNLLLASCGGNDVEENSFVPRLLKIVAGMFNQPLYSDLTIRLKETNLFGHKFILSARAQTWASSDLSTMETLDLSALNNEIAFSLVKWIYTDHIDLTGKSEDFILEIMKAAKSYNLTSLVEKCEKTLMSFVVVKNCVKFYQIADELNVENLRNHCSELISNHWDDFTSDDFAHMSAPLLFSMFKTKTDHPLHTAIRVGREDVVFLYLIENDANLGSKVNEMDRLGDIPLDLALKSKQEGVARTLLNHKANVNAVDSKGCSLLHRAIVRKDDTSADFLLENNVMVDALNTPHKETPLHVLASQPFSDGMTRITKKLLSRGADVNIQDSTGNTALHRAIASRNIQVFRALIESPRTSLEIRNSDGATPLALALKCTRAKEPDTFATLLVEKGASVDATNPMTGDTLLHLCCKDKNEAAGIFLVVNGAKVNSCNNRGETALHLAALHGLAGLVHQLLANGANCNLMTSASFDGGSCTSNSLSSSSNNSSSPFDCEVDDDYMSNVYNQTPLHLAILAGHEDVIKTLVTFKASTSTNDLTSHSVSPNLNLKNSRQQTPLSLALSMGMHSVAQLLIDEGANINSTNSEGLTLMHEAIIAGEEKSALFLLNYGSDTNVKTPDGQSPLQLAVKHKLCSVVRELCAKGAEVDTVDEDGTPLLWTALESLDEDIASILVEYQCDSNCWGPGPGGCWQTLLHRALDENNEDIACFLIRSGCDVNSPRRPSPTGEGDEEAHDGQTPLHLACSWGLERVTEALIEHGADINVQDAEGKTPIQVAISNQNFNIINLLLSNAHVDLNTRDKFGCTAFATAMSIKNNKAASAILKKEPTAAERHDGKGRNFLHVAVQKGDLESVLFLMSIGVNIHSRVLDSNRATPLHLAVEVGSEMIVRNLLLAGAVVNDTTNDKKSPLHIAAEKDRDKICSILIENGADVNALDTHLNNALHYACQKGNFASVKVLLSESRIDAEAVNLRGQNPLHCLCQYVKEDVAAVIFDLFMTCMPNYPINKTDGDGNSPLLLAYINGNWNLCRNLIQRNSCVGQTNKHGVNIFNMQVASKTLLYKILDHLPSESPWTEGDQCLECGMKFGLTNRKHHCRHCGRLLCAKCSPREVIINKFKCKPDHRYDKPVRVCEQCDDILTMGFNSG